MTAKTANLNIKLDPSVKEQADKVFSAMGMTTTSAVNIFIQRVINTQEFPFTPSAKTPALEAIEEYRNGNYETFSSKEDLMKDLLSDD